MKTKFLKGVAVLLSMTMAAAGVHIGNVYAEEEHPDFKMYLCTGENRSDTVYVSTEDVAKGNVTVPVSVYTVSEEWTSPSINYIFYAWAASDPYNIRFENPLDYTKVVGDQTYTYSGGTFQSKYIPHMMAPLTNRMGKYGYFSPACMYY
ncbi:MAG: hypothetical protein ACI4JN_08875, partial [Ruminococcus sp.]